MFETLGKQSFVWGLSALCQLNRVPFDAELLLHRFTPPFDLAALQQAAIELGFKVSFQPVPLSDIHPSALPLLAILKPAANGEAPPAANTESPQQISPPGELPATAHSNHRLALILKIDDERVLCVYEGNSTPENVSLDQFNQETTGQVLFAKRRIEQVAEDGSSAKGTDGQLKLDAKFSFKWFIPELLKHKKIWREVLAASFAMQLVALATPICTQVIIDKVVVHHTTSTLIVIASALGLFLIFNAIMGWVRQYLVLHTGNRMDAVLGHRVFSHLLHLPIGYFDHRPTGTLVARLHGVEIIREFLAGSLVTLILDFPFLIIFLLIMFWYSWQLSLIAMASLTLITLLSLAITPLLRKKLNHQFLLGARNQAFLTEYVSGMETVKSLQLEPQLQKKYGDYLSNYLASTFDAKQLSNTYNIAANTLDQLQTLSILCAGAWIVMHNPEFTIGMLVAFQMFSGRLSGPVLRLVGMYQEFQQADIAVKRLGDLMDAPSEPYSLIPSRTFSEEGKIELENLGFRYSENHPWLYRNLSLAIKPGKCTAIMGPSGCGKSTLAKLLLGFYRPQEGSIRLDGRDTKFLSANELRSHFGVVPQETILFSGTLYDNLVLANPHAGFEDVIQACQLAGIHEVIENLPNGYQTPIGEHGTGLSGGQKQRMAIARALLRQPKILIFDEAISNLDQQTSEHFSQTVNRLKGKVTILFITHQLPKGLHVDETILLGKDMAKVGEDDASHQDRK